MNRGGATRTASKRNREIYENTTTISGEYTVITSIAWPKMLPTDVRLFQGYCMALCFNILFVAWIWYGTATRLYTFALKNLVI